MSTVLTERPVAAEVPQAPSTTRKSRRPRALTVILSAVAVGTLAFAAFQTTTLAGVNEDLTASQGTVTNLRSENSVLESDLGNALASVDSLEGTVAGQDAQLASCYQANSLSVQADKSLHAAIAQIVPAAFGGSDYRFDAALARYQDKAGQWADAANACEGGGNTYSFG
jgi:hypothetical protein